MSWQPPRFLDPMSDRAMMEEVLELLVTDSPDRDGSLTASSSNPPSLSGFSHGSVTDQDGRVGQGGIGELEVMRVVGSRNEDPNNDSEVEDKHPVPGGRAEQTAVQEQKQAAVLGVGQQMPSKPQAVPRRQMMPLQSHRLGAWSSSHAIQHDPRVLAGSPGMIAAAAAIPASSLTPVPAGLSMGQVAGPASTPLAATVRLTPQPAAAAARLIKRAASSTEHVLPTGQRVRVMNGAEFDELRRKLRMQTASRRYRKRKKDEARRQKTKIQELQAELSRLRELEAQLKRYQQRSEESLEAELNGHEEEIRELWGKVQAAAKEELDWVKRMSSHLRE